ncbi:hypothetical protein [Demequina sp. NBRC 110055]|uniref:hypothetical protein n=1 Tax=Demequina sp. NBRC 110055 TaxID=1570344 RepID=UPI0009FBF4AB|nr:hypothetical protein [Demequina sp. NBRC 110055]
MPLTLHHSTLTATLQGRKWVVTDSSGTTVAWIVPAGAGWSLSRLTGSDDVQTFASAQEALESLASS